MKKILTFVFLFMILFLTSFTMAAGTCSGEVHNCQSHKDDQNACTASGCIYDVDKGKCEGTHNVCSTYSSQSTCETHSCIWTELIPTEGEGVQAVIGIFPRTPIAGDELYSETIPLKVEIYYAGEPSNGAIVKANSSMFGEVTLKHTSALPIGVYTANVTINEKTYGNNKILYIVEQSQQYNEAFVIVTLKPSLEIVTDLEQVYYKDNIMSFNGTVLNRYNTTENNSLVKITGYQNGNSIFYLETFTNEKGKFYSEYLIKHGDPEGDLDILFEAKSKTNKFGSKSLSTSINVSPGAVYYSVNFLSPLREKVFRRGEVVPVTIEVKDRTEFVNKASVIIYGPSGDNVLLKEVGEGKYSGVYQIKPNDPIDNWLLKAEVKTQVDNYTKVGGANIPITVAPAEIFFDILSPNSEVIYTNSRMYFKIKLTYLDGSLVKGAKLKVILLDKNKEIQLQETSSGIYQGSYFVGAEETSELIFKIDVEDIEDNFGTLNKSFLVKKRSFVGNILAFIWDIILLYWWAILVFLIVLFMIFKSKLEMAWIKWNIAKSLEEQKNIKIMQIEIERKYYNEGSITKKEFKDITGKYEERMTKAKEVEKIYQKKLNQKLTELNRNIRK